MLTSLRVDIGEFFFWGGIWVYGWYMGSLFRREIKVASRLGEISPTRLLFESNGSRKIGSSDCREGGIFGYFSNEFGRLFTR